MKIRNIIVTIIALVGIIACNNGPKIITSQSNNGDEKSSSGIFTEESTNESETKTSNQSSFTDNLHSVLVNEILPTSKYVYLKVTEEGDQFWVATRRQDVILGNTYFFRDGLLKTNYESKEYSRVFEKIYLVSNLVDERHGNNKGTLNNNFIQSKSKEVKKEVIPTHTEKIVQHAGSINISEIVANPKKYEGKIVQITGKCVKINPNIMERNWIHLQDGSKDDYDFVITSDTFVPEGKIITISALVSINRDFGAGYRYDLILENGTIIN